MPLVLLQVCSRLPSCGAQLVMRFFTRTLSSQAHLYDLVGWLMCVGGEGGSSCSSSCHMAGCTCTVKQRATCMQVQFHAEHSWRGRDEPVPDWSVCTLVHQCLHASGHRGVSAGQHLPHGGLHADAAASWGMQHCLYNIAFIILPLECCLYNLAFRILHKQGNC